MFTSEGSIETITQSTDLRYMQSNNILRCQKISNELKPHIFCRRLCCCGHNSLMLHLGSVRLLLYLITLYFWVISNCMHTFHLPQKKHLAMSDWLKLTDTADTKSRCARAARSSTYEQYFKDSLQLYQSDPMNPISGISTLF